MDNEKDWGKLKPYEISDRLRELYDEKSEYERMRNVFSNQEQYIKMYKAITKQFWAKARKKSDFDNEAVHSFISTYNRYSEISKSDRDKMLRMADFSERVVNDKYKGLIDKKYWEGEHIIFIISYLEDGRAKTVEEAVELYEKDGGRY